MFPGMLNAESAESCIDLVHNLTAPQLCDGKMNLMIGMIMQDDLTSCENALELLKSLEFNMIFIICLGSIKVSAVRSNYQFRAKKPAAINNFKLQFAVITSSTCLQHYCESFNVGYFYCYIK